MKRKSSPAGPATCECCGDEESAPGAYRCFEGYITCEACRVNHGAELTARRRREDAKTLGGLR
jgi:hypothetical protein